MPRRAVPRFRISPAQTLGGLAILVAALHGGAVQAQTPMNDRDKVLPRGVLTSDDPQRIPKRPSTAPAKQVVLRGGRVFDAIRPVAYPATVVIEGRIIKAILPPGEVGWAADAQVIDVAGKTVMPGLIDMHVHMTYPDPDTPIDEQDTEGGGVLRGTRNLRIFLESGFTSVRDLGGVRNAPFQLAQWSAAGRMPAPRVFAAGHIITGTGGHATERPITPNHGPAYQWERNGADAWRAAVREAFKQGASVIKVAVMAEVFHQAEEGRISEGGGAKAAERQKSQGKMLVRERIVFAELKATQGNVTAAQHEWLQALGAAGQEVYIWRPAHWAFRRRISSTSPG